LNHFITDPKACFQAERRLDGKFKHYAHGNGRVDVIPAFLNHSTNWNQEVEFSVIAICSTFLNQTTQKLMQREIELTPQLGNSACRSFGAELSRNFLGDRLWDQVKS
jgi:hypothetical protein